MKKRLLFASFVFMFSILMVSSFSLSDLFSGGITGDAVNSGATHKNSLGYVAKLGKLETFAPTIDSNCNEDLDDDPLCIPVWQRVDFSGNGFGNGVTPVVIVKPVSSNDGTPAHVRIKNIDNRGFSMKLENWDGSSHGTETVTYFAMKGGSYELDGKQIVAGFADFRDYQGHGIYANNTMQEYNLLDFSSRYNFPEDGPEVVLLTQSQTSNGNPIITRNDDVTKSSFKIRVQESSESSPHFEDRVGYVMAQKGTYDFGSMILEVGPNSLVEIGSSGGSLFFSNDFVSSSNIFFLADMQTTLDDGTAELRFSNLDGDSVDLLVEEVDSTSHSAESIGYFVYGTSTNPSDASDDPADSPLPGVCSGERNYFVTGTTSKGSVSEIDTCPDGNTLREFYCDDNEVVHVDVPCDCAQGACELPGDGRVCKSIEISSVSITVAGEDTTTDVRISDPTGSTVDISVGESNVSDIIDGDIWDKLKSGDLSLELSKAPIKFRQSNLVGSGAGDNGIPYYCGIHSIWHQTLPTLKNLNCIKAGDDCGRDTFRANYPDFPDYVYSNDSDDVSIALSEAEAISACLVGEGCPDFVDTTLYPDPFDEIDESKCLEDYECQSNFCSDGYCISISEELEIQRGFLVNIWCVISNLPSYLAEREDDPNYLECLASPNPFS